MPKSKQTPIQLAAQILEPPGHLGGAPSRSLDGQLDLVPAENRRGQGNRVLGPLKVPLERFSGVEPLVSPLGHRRVETKRPRGLTGLQGIVESEQLTLLARQLRHSQDELHAITLDSLAEFLGGVEVVASSESAPRPSRLMAVSTMSKEGAPRAPRSQAESRGRTAQASPPRLRHGGRGGRSKPRRHGSGHGQNLSPCHLEHLQ